MAKRTRAVKRGVKTRAPTRAPKRASARLSKKRAIKSRRLQFTPALIADVRRRYERTSEGLATLAADLGSSVETVRNIAGREGWRRYVPPPRDLSPAAKLAARAQALTQTPFVPAQAGTQNQTRDADGLGPGSPPARGRTDDDCITTRNAGEPPPLAATAEALHHELQMLLAGVTAARERMKREGSGKHDLRDAAQVIANLTATLRRLQPMLGAPAKADQDHDDMPADIDEFRRDLARRIDAFVASRTESRHADGDPGTEPLDEVR